MCGSCWSSALYHTVSEYSAIVSGKKDDLLPGWDKLVPETPSGGPSQ